VAAFGYRPNHFTVFINALKSFADIQSLNVFLKEQGVKLNASGGEIKGTPAVYLEQSSTLANNIAVTFDDGELTIPACYYEFARRYPLASGELYQGFVAASADKIFESTSKGQ
ncbi:MAG: 2-oxoadipate dioxygenase/decarboxylase family protein, partial [Bacteriovoracia bacterium]